MPPAPAERSYSPGATLVPLFCWALMLGVVAWLLVRHGLNQAADSDLRLPAVLMAAVAMLFGPVAFVAHFLRHCMVSVRVDTDRGLRFSRGRIIPWDEIRSVELREAAFRGMIRASPLMLLLTAGCLSLIYYVVLPSMALFTPWHRRVILVLQSGERIILRDLIDAEDFMTMVSILMTKTVKTPETSP